MEKEKKAAVFENFMAKVLTDLDEEGHLERFIYDGDGLNPIANIETFKDRRYNDGTDSFPFSSILEARRPHTHTYLQSSPCPELPEPGRVTRNEKRRACEILT